jgi:hypothetical protein
VAEAARVADHSCDDFDEFFVFDNHWVLLDEGAVRVAAIERRQFQVGPNQGALLSFAARQSPV